MSHKKISDEQRNMMKELRKAGLTFEGIGKLVDCCPASVAYWDDIELSRLRATVKVAEKSVSRCPFIYGSGYCARTADYPPEIVGGSIICIFSKRVKRGIELKECPIGRNGIYEKEIKQD